MSIVALKRNSRRFQVPISAGNFSLNGGIRNQRLIGSTNLQALTASQNRPCENNDPSIIKPSVKNTMGHLLAAVKYPVCDTACGVNGNKDIVTWVKNYSPENHSQSEYIKNQIQARAAQTVTKKVDSGANNSCADCRKVRSYYIGGRRIYVTFNAKNSGKYGQGAISEGEYLKAWLLKKKCLPVPCKQLPFPPALLNSGCNVFASTPQEAIAKGLLPPDWTG